MIQQLQDNLFLIYFLYGLAFFLMGWSILIQAPRQLNPFSRGLAMVAAFGLLHGVVEWIDMYRHAAPGALSDTGSIVMGAVRVFLLGFSFLCLAAAGLQLASPRRLRQLNGLVVIWLAALLTVALTGLLSRWSSTAWRQILIHLDVLTRYFLALPASLLISFGLWRNGGLKRHHYDQAVVRRTRVAITCFAVYAVLGGLFTPADSIGLAWLLNDVRFLQWTRLPIQLFRALTAVGIMVAFVFILELFRREEAARDSKTGLNTVQAVYRFLDIKIQQARPFSILFIDIDRFKQINDTKGHLVGDQVLKQLAHLLQSGIRSLDFAGRFGGEEFIVILPEQDPENAADAAERLRRSVEQTAFAMAADGTSLRVTVSIGVAGWQPGVSVEQLLTHADEAMYAAKSQGRNQVVLAGRIEKPLALGFVQLVWSEQWDSGHAEIDAHHHNLVSLGNELIAMTVDSASHEALLAQVDRIIRHLARHFTVEEQILESLGYPGLENHAAIHQQLVQAAIAFRAHADAENLLPGESFAFIVNEIIMGHLLKDDAAYFPYTRRQSLPASPDSKAEVSAVIA